jgi:hypothetical protein
MDFLTLAIKFRDVAYLLVIATLGLLVYALRLEITEIELAQQRAVYEKQMEADEWANRLIAKQAEWQNSKTTVVTKYIDRIRNVTTPDTACAADERMRIGNHGVREIVLDGPQTERGPADTVPAPVARP